MNLSGSRGFIYLIVSRNNHGVYIGSTMNLEQRWNRHRGRLNLGKHWNRHLQNVWKKYGSEKFEFIEIEECSEEILTEREQFWIDDMRHVGMNVYNQADAGRPVSWLGRKHSEETKQKLSEINTGKTQTEETKSKISQSNIGREVSEETRSKISIKAMGHKRNLGRVHSNEMREKLRLANLGKVTSNETRRKISESKKQYWQEKRNQ